jgi:hypothetical protein
VPGAALFLLLTVTIVAASGGSSSAQPAAASNCSAYCVAEGCGWTTQYSCPWSAAPGTKGRAKDSGTIAKQLAKPTYLHGMLTQHDIARQVESRELLPSFRCLLRGFAARN